MAFPKGLLTLSKLLSMQGIEEVVVCPGSRNAPIIIALERNPDLKLYSIVDERSAGFFALGKALATQKPVAVCCSSGSAGLNLAPALSEAYYQEIPILALTADRPAEWIDQWDGQTIRQKNFLDSVVKKSLEFPQFASNEASLDWFQQRIANEAILGLTTGQSGPVHLNIPISEPFYPSAGEKLHFPDFVRKVELPIFQENSAEELKAFFEKNIQAEQRIILSIGQLEHTQELIPLLENLSQKGIVLLGDSTANASSVLIQNHDLILSNDKIWHKLQANLVIHIGKSHVSKRIKQFFRKSNLAQNWLIKKGSESQLIDTFQSLTHVLAVDTRTFLEQFDLFLQDKFLQKNFSNDWKELSKIVTKRQNNFIFENSDWNELHAVQSVMHAVQSSTSSIHFGNSLSIRYSNWLPFFPNGEVYCNRGTSGIDGTVSTYIGATSLLEDISYLIIGDLSFHYDKNGLWNQYLSKNQRIIVLNNSGGGIFRNLEGARDLPELEKFIATRQQNSAKSTAEEAGMHYFKADNSESLQHALKKLAQKSDHPSLLEIFTDPDQNKEVLSNYMGLFKS